jgi:hypothetical protein
MSQGVGPLGVTDCPLPWEEIHPLIIGLFAIAFVNKPE